MKMEYKRILTERNNPVNMFASNAIIKIKAEVSHELKDPKWSINEKPRIVSKSNYEIHKIK